MQRVFPVLGFRLLGVHLGRQHAAQVIPLLHHQPTRSLDLDVHHAVLVGTGQMRQHPGAVLGVDVRRRILGDLHHLIGEAAPDRDRVAVLVLVAAPGRIAADDIAATLGGLVPDLQLEQMMLVGRTYLRELHRPEIVPVAIIIAGEPVIVRIIINRLQILRDLARLEERIAAQHKRLLGGPRLVLAQHIGLGAGVLLLPPDPAQLLGRDDVLVLASNQAHEVALLARGLVATVPIPARIGAPDLVHVRRPPPDEKRSLGLLLLTVGPDRVPVVVAVGRRLENKQPRRVGLRQGLQKRRQPLGIPILRNLRRMTGRIATALGPGHRFTLRPRNQKIYARPVRELHELAVVAAFYDAERVPEVAIWKRPNIATQDHPVRVAVLLRVRNQSHRKIRVKRKPEQINRQRNSRAAQLPTLQAIEAPDPIIQTLPDLVQEPLLRLPQYQRRSTLIFRHHLLRDDADVLHELPKQRQPPRRAGHQCTISTLSAPRRTTSQSPSLLGPATKLITAPRSDVSRPRQSSSDLIGNRSPFIRTQKRLSKSMWKIPSSPITPAPNSPATIEAPAARLPREAATSDDTPAAQAQAAAQPTPPASPTQPLSAQALAQLPQACDPQPPRSLLPPLYPYLHQPTRRIRYRYLQR